MVTNILPKTRVKGWHQMTLIYLSRQSEGLARPALPEKPPAPPCTELRSQARQGYKKPGPTPAGKTTHPVFLTYGGLRIGPPRGHQKCTGKLNDSSQDGGLRAGFASQLSYSPTGWDANGEEAIKDNAVKAGRSGRWVMRKSSSVPETICPAT